MLNGIIVLIALAASTNSAHAAGLEGLNFSVINPDQWNLKNTAEGWIDDLTPNQTIQYGVVQDPTDRHIVYFASSAPVKTTTNEDGVLLSIYRYNTSTLIYERLWRATYGPGDITGFGADALPEWNVIGYDNGDVIFVQLNADYTAPACLQSVLIGFDAVEGATLHALPGNFTDSWVSGPSDYAPPQELINQARAAQSQCEGQQPQ